METNITPQEALDLAGIFGDFNEIKNAHHRLLVRTVREPERVLNYLNSLKRNAEAEQHLLDKLREVAELAIKEKASNT